MKIAFSFPGMGAGILLFVIFKIFNTLSGYITYIETNPYRTFFTFAIIGGLFGGIMTDPK